jgi:diguanylate cyclase
MAKTKIYFIYSAVLLAWLLVTSVMMGLVVKIVLQQVEAAFNQRVVQLHEKIEHIARDSESILEGFAAFLGAIEYADRESASRYARQILSHYPHVFRLEVILRVERKDLAEFVARQKRTWFPEFHIRPVDYGPGEAQVPVANKPLYYPIIFVEPNLASDKRLIGTDVDSAPFLSRALNQSMQAHSSIATVPFTLAEGPRGYILVRPVLRQQRPPIPKQKQAFVALEVSADAIRKEIDFLIDNQELRLYPSGYASNDPEGLLIFVPGPLRNRFEIEFLPKFETERALNKPGQPYLLRVSQQLSRSEINLPLVIATSCFSLLSLIFLLFLLSSYFKREQQRKQSADHLLHLATHDPLTGLPNRTLLADRFSQACTRAQRRKTQFSIIFIDLNGFKAVNDTYGHDIGDQLLITSGLLLQECIRHEDTLCRISGDEFVILLENTTFQNAGVVANKILARSAEPVLTQGIELTPSFSLGIAVYPEDGTTMTEILRKADQRMYAAKGENRKNRRTLLSRGTVFRN